MTTLSGATHIIKEKQLLFLSQRAHKALPHSQCAAGLGRQGEENTQDGQSIPCLGLGKDGIQNRLDSLSFDIAHQLILLPVSNANDTSTQCKSIQNWATSTEGQKYYPSSAPSESTHRCPAPPISSRLREPSNSGRSFLLRLAAQDNLSVRMACRVPNGCSHLFGWPTLLLCCLTRRRRFAQRFLLRSSTILTCNNANTAKAHTEQP